jgi:hypothetical protein
MNQPRPCTVGEHRCTALYFWFFYVLTGRAEHAEQAHEAARQCESRQAAA